MRYRPQQPAALRTGTGLRDALLFQKGNPGKNLGRANAPATSASPSVSMEGVSVNNFPSAWTYPGGYAALPITVVIDFRTLGSAIVSRHALWTSRSGSSGSGGLYFRYADSGGLELLRSQAALMVATPYALPSRGGAVAFTYDGSNYKIAAGGSILVTGSDTQACVFDTPSVGVEGGTQSLDGDISNSVFRGVFVYPRILSDAELIAHTTNPYRVVQPPEEDDFIPSTGPSSTGTLAVSEGIDNMVAAGSVLVGGTASMGEGSDALASSGNMTVPGSGSASEGSDTATGSGSASNGSTGSLLVSEGVDTLVSVGSVAISGTASMSELPDTARGYSSSSAPIILPFVQTNRPAGGQTKFGTSLKDTNATAKVNGVGRTVTSQDEFTVNITPVVEADTVDILYNVIIPKEHQ